MASYVYLITNKINNKYYIGKTNNKNLRWSQHKSKSKKDNSYFYNALRKYGADNFIFEIIKECMSEEDAYEYERVLIELFGLRNKKYGYNIIDGGSGGSRGYKVSKKLKKYFSEKYVGEKSINAKYSSIQILEILNKYATGKYTAKQLAVIYDCSKVSMIRIISGESYSDVVFDRSKFYEIGKNNRKNNIPSGIKSSTSKLSISDISEIKKLRVKGYSYQKIADLFEVTKVTIGNLIKGKTYI